MIIPGCQRGPNPSRVCTVWPLLRDPELQGGERTSAPPRALLPSADLAAVLMTMNEVSLVCHSQNTGFVFSFIPRKYFLYLRRVVVIYTRLCFYWFWVFAYVEWKREWPKENTGRACLSSWGRGSPPGPQLSPKPQRQQNVHFYTYIHIHTSACTCARTYPRVESSCC